MHGREWLGNEWNLVLEVLNLKCWIVACASAEEHGLSHELGLSGKRGVIHEDAHEGLQEAALGVIALGWKGAACSPALTA